MQFDEMNFNNKERVPITIGMMRQQRAIAIIRFSNNFLPDGQ
jgi:hypothetical protein